MFVPGITYLTGENFLDVLDNGAELCQLAVVIHEKAKEALDQGLIVGVSIVYANVNKIIFNIPKPRVFVDLLDISNNWLTC